VPQFQRKDPFQHCHNGTIGVPFFFNRIAVQSAAAVTNNAIFCLKFNSSMQAAHTTGFSVRIGPMFDGAVLGPENCLKCHPFFFIETQYFLQHKLVRIFFFLSTKIN